MEFTEEQVIPFIKENLKTPKWVDDSRKRHKVLKALVLGEKFTEVLVQKIEKIESERRAIARKRYSKDIRDMFGRVMQPRHSVFNASGGSLHTDIPIDAQKRQVLQSLSEFKGQKSLKKYLSENFFRFQDTDPNGVILLEYIEDEDIFPVYKSINTIRNYVSNGQLCEFILFEPQTKRTGNLVYNEWRLIDDKTDWRIIQNGETWSVNPDKTFEHPFGNPPCTILSDLQDANSELRVNSLYIIEELTKEYARDKSIKTIYKFQHGFPRHWRYVKECKACKGTGKTGDDPCRVCDGKGIMQRNDVTDIQTLALPRERDKIITPNVEGFVSPDLETWEMYNKDLLSMEELIESTMWGTRRLKEGGNETATGRWIDVQPVMNKLDWFTDGVEWTHNQLADFTVNWVYSFPQEEKRYRMSYGRRFIIESPDVILEKYTASRKDGDNVTILDKLLDEYILSKYQADPIMLALMQKKRMVEPYVHNSIIEVGSLFGSNEAYKKVLFVDFWEQADTGRTAEQLKEDFNQYVINNQIPVNNE